MAKTRITSKGQVTIPKDVRRSTLSMRAVSFRMVCVLGQRFIHHAGTPSLILNEL